MKKRKPQATRSRKFNNNYHIDLLAKKPLFIGVAVLLVSISIYAAIPRDPHMDVHPDQAVGDLRQTQLKLNLANTNNSEIAHGNQDSTDPKVEIYEVKNGDNMGLLFKRAGLGPTIVHRLAYESEHGKAFANIRPGKHFHFTFDEDNSAARIDYVISPLERYIAEATEGGFVTRHELLEPDISPAFAVGEIKSSLYNAGVDAGLPDNLILELANIFGWDIDFILDIRKGDQFSVMYEQRFINGEKLGNGNILAAEFVNRGKSYKAVRYEDTNGRAAFYTPEGESMKKAFLRTPLDVFRISDHFNPNRKHPILNTLRAHKGVDYAAPRGTPIKAAGAGRIVYASRQGGYGNVIKIKHPSSYKTVYAHLDKFARGMKVGKTVDQGDIIGYVGSTGLATGPHLHYEFHVNGAARNPVTVDLPNGTPIHKSEFDRFKENTENYVSLLNNMNIRLVYADLSDQPDS